MTEYILVQNDDAEWYVIPACKEVDWWEHVYPDQDAIQDCAIPDPSCDDTPNYAVRVGGTVAQLMSSSQVLG